MKPSELKTKVETITPAMAEHYLTGNVSNRPVKSRTVDFYASEMSRGKWELNGEPIIIARSRAILNGQHRLLAVLKSGATIKSLVVEGVDDDSFATIDQGTARTGGDILSIAGVTNANKVSSAISKYNALKRSFILFEFTSMDRGIKLSKSDILNEYNRDPNFWDTIVSVGYQCYDGKRLFSPSAITGTMAYLILEKRHNRDVVFSFYRQLSGSDKVMNNTITLLVNKIVDASLRGYKLAPRYKTALLIKTFNAYLVGKQYKTLSYNEEIEKYPTFL